MKIDLFNKKKVKALERDTVLLWSRLAEYEKRFRELEKPRCYDSFDAVPENSHLSKITEHIGAMIHYLGIEFSRECEDDPRYLKPEPIQRTVLKAYKKKSKE